MSESLSSYVDRIVKKAIKDGTSVSKMKKIAKSTAIEVKRRTRLGYGVAGHNRKRTKLKALAREYIAYRRLVGTHRETSARKSNLTLTGQMLNALKGEGLKSGIRISFSENRKEGDLTNSEVAKRVSGARPFMILATEKCKD